MKRLKDGNIGAFFEAKVRRVVCPVCDGMFPEKDIAEHTDAHFRTAPCAVPATSTAVDAAGGGVGGMGGVFAHMMQRSREAKSRAFFGLYVQEDGSLYPSFSFTDPRAPQSVQGTPNMPTSPSAPFAFECTISLKDFAHIGCPPLTMVLHSNTALLPLSRGQERSPEPSSTSAATASGALPVAATSADLPAAAATVAAAVTRSPLKQGQAVPGVSIAFLKSALQKGCRRREAGTCVRLAAFLLGVKGMTGAVPQSVSTAPPTAAGCEGGLATPLAATPAQGPDNCRAYDCLERDDYIARECTDELLRRLPCIALEDGALTPLFPMLVWCMCAHGKGFNLPDGLLTSVLAAVVEVATAPLHDTLVESGAVLTPPSGSMAAGVPCTPPSALAVATLATAVTAPATATTAVTTDGTTVTARLEKSSPALRTAVAAILVRACYGGMVGDVTAMRQFAVSWLDRDRATALPMSTQSSPQLSSSLSSSSSLLDPTSTPTPTPTHTHTPSPTPIPTPTLLPDYATDLEASVVPHWRALLCSGVVDSPCTPGSSQWDHSGQGSGSGSRGGHDRRYRSYLTGSTRAASISTASLAARSAAMLRSTVARTQRTEPTHRPHASPPPMSLDLTLCRCDLLPCAVDKHCDMQVVYNVMAKGLAQGLDRDADNVAAAIWLFCGSLNTRPVYALQGSTRTGMGKGMGSDDVLVRHTAVCAQEQQARVLARKRELAPVWRDICREVAAYAENKTAHMFSDIQKHYLQQ